MNSISQKTMRSIVSLGLGALLLSACSLAPSYERPLSPAAEAWPDSSGVSAAPEASLAGAPNIRWEEFFLDESLKRIIALALENNRDLRVSILNIERARALYHVQAADRVPSVNAGFSGARQDLPADVNPTGVSGVFDSYTASMGVTAFELDLFGRVRNMSDSALERYAATEEAQRSAQISLIAEVASLYEAILADRDLLALSRQTVASRTESYQLQIRLLELGASSALELRQSESLMEAARIALARQTRRQAIDENAISVLIGKPLDTIDLPSEGLQFLGKIMADLPAGVPSELIAARPDIRQQEALLRSTNANIGVARAAFFPRISLTGMFGSSSSELSGLFDNGTRTWNFLPQVSLPIFDGGRNRANLRIANVDRDVAVAQYEKAIQIAFREVADALAGRATLREELRAVRAQEVAEQVRHDLSKLRYNNGQSSYLEYLDAQRSLFATQQETIRTNLAELQNQISLYKALGGGWHTQSAELQ